MNTKTAPLLLDAVELAEVFRVAPVTVLEWVRKGRIPCIRINRKTLRFDVDRVLAALEVPARQSASALIPLKGGKR
jgi:predicted site-specific integrase-resolvase